MDGRGLVFTLDALVAASLVFLVLAYVNGMVGENNVGDWSGTRMLESGYDTADVLYNTGALQAMNVSWMERIVNSTTPPNTAMSMRILSYTNSSGQMMQSNTMNIGPPVPDSQAVAYGKRTFLTFKDGGVEYYNVAEFWVWSK